jgi:stage V sporulation protein D (sporulation-specific penicillin-binding protein)
MREIVKYYNMTPFAKPGAVTTGQNPQKSTGLSTVPNCLYLPVTKASRILRENGFAVKVEGNGERVVDVVPGVGSQINYGEIVTLYAVVQNPLPEGEVWVPNLQGKTIRETGELLSQADLSFYPVGSGLAIRQEPAFGAKIRAGSTVTVYFADRSPP